jgi:H(+)-transporting ATP synthase subunit D
MSRGARLTTNRLELLRARQRLGRVWMGSNLLRKRREALARELIGLARPAVDARAALTEQSREAYRQLPLAYATAGATGLRALGWPHREINLTIDFHRVWGVGVAGITERPAIRRSIEARGQSPAAAGPVVTDTAARFETLIDLLIDAAPREMLLRRLGDALARTSRQVHALEKNVAPELASEIRRVRDSLDEREREEHHRLKHFLRMRDARASGAVR